MGTHYPTLKLITNTSRLSASTSLSSVRCRSNVAPGKDSRLGWWRQEDPLFDEMGMVLHFGCACSWLTVGTRTPGMGALETRRVDLLRVPY